MKRRIVIIGVIVIVVAAVFFIVARDRGALYFTGWQPYFSFVAFKNPPPSLNRPIHFPETFPVEAQAIFNANLAKTKDALVKNPRDVAAWFDLAIDYRMVGDHEGAVEIWKYVSAMNPKEGVSLHNLGEYYFHTAKDYPTAESYYMRSIAVAPQFIQNYADMADMYTYVYRQDTGAAPEILKKGIANIDAPANMSLVIQLATYYAAKNDSKDARTYYTQALKIAETMKNPTLAAQIRQSIYRLK